MKKQTKFGLVLAAAAVISVSVASLVSARGWVQQGADWYYVDNNGEYVTDTIQSSGNSKFYLGEDGAMMRDYFLEEYGDSNNAYYFGANGAMVTNTWVAIESSRVENQEDYVPDNYWYYFQASGKAMKGASSSVKKTTIDGKKYAFNEYGQMLTGWIDDQGKVISPDDNENPFDSALYYAGGDNDGVLRSGWVTYYDGYDGGDDRPESDYTNLYFYFNTSNNKKYGHGKTGGETKKINGKTYAFSEEGVMLSGWDAWEQGVVTGAAKYFSGEDDGHQVKKGWVYAVPAEDINRKKYEDDEEQYMYFGSSGDITADQFKKVNGKFYVFDRTGLMKTGVIIWCAEGTNSYKYVDKLDLDYAEGSDVAKKGILTTGDGENIQVNEHGEVIGNLNNTKAANGAKVKLHLYGSDGARKTGANNVEFADDTYVLQTNGSTGDKGSGSFSKKYYSLGIQLKASSDIRYGIFTLASSSEGGKLQAQATDWANNLHDGDKYVVLTTGGSILKGNNGAKKDADGNYWLIEKGSNILKGIWTVNVNNNKGYSNFETRWGDAVAASITVSTTSSAYTIEDVYRAGLAVASNANDAFFDSTTGAPLQVFSATVDGNKVRFKCATSISGPAFQSDINDGSNKWIPMGIFDNAGQTVVLDPTSTTDAKAHAYDVTPTNDYFLNCYWNA